MLFVREIVSVLFVSELVSVCLFVSVFLCECLLVSEIVSVLLVFCLCALTVRETFCFVCFVSETFVCFVSEQDCKKYCLCCLLLLCDFYCCFHVYFVHKI